VSWVKISAQNGLTTNRGSGDIPFLHIIVWQKNRMRRSSVEINMDEIANTYFSEEERRIMLTPSAQWTLEQKHMLDRAYARIPANVRSAISAHGQVTDPAGYAAARLNGMIDVFNEGYARGQSSVNWLLVTSLVVGVIIAVLLIATR
jgi:hypothetical protein